MNDKHSRPESGNGQPPDADTRDADLTAFALDQLTAEEYQAIQQRLSDDPASAESANEIRTLARLLRDSTPVDNYEPSASLRAELESHLDKLEQPADKVTLPDQAPTRNREWAAFGRRRECYGIDCRFASMGRDNEACKQERDDGTHTLYTTSVIITICVVLGFLEVGG